jgi:hypothetical protein
MRGELPLSFQPVREQEQIDSLDRSAPQKAEEAEVEEHSRVLALDLSWELVR